MSNITAYDYLPQRTKNRIARDNERRRQARIAAFLPDLSAHRYVEMTDRLSGIMELHGVAHLRGSSERWVKATIHDRHAGAVLLLVPRSMCGIGASRIVAGQCTAYPVIIDICSPTWRNRLVTWVDRNTHYTVESRLPIALRRHA